MYKNNTNSENDKNQQYMYNNQYPQISNNNPTMQLETGVVLPNNQMPNPPPYNNNNNNKF